MKENKIRTELNAISGQVVSSSIKVHSTVGPGLLESPYRTCLAYELGSRKLHVETDVTVPIIYDGVKLETGLQIDLLVERLVVVELKAVRQLHPVHEAQLLSYLRLGDYRLGLLINFHVIRLRDGIKRIVNNF